MEKLTRKDKESKPGSTAREKLSARQKEKIAEIRREIQAKLAELEILFKSERRTARGVVVHRNLAAFLGWIPGRDRQGRSWEFSAEDVSMRLGRLPLVSPIPWWAGASRRLPFCRGQAGWTIGSTRRA